LALEKGGDASVVVSTLGTVAKGAGLKDLLLVIEGFEFLFKILNDSKSEKFKT